MFCFVLVMNQELLRFVSFVVIILTDYSFLLFSSYSSFDFLFQSNVLHFLERLIICHFITFIICDALHVPARAPELMMSQSCAPG